MIELSTNLWAACLVASGAMQYVVQGTRRRDVHAHQHNCAQRQQRASQVFDPIGMAECQH